MRMNGLFLLSARYHNEYPKKFEARDFIVANNQGGWKVRNFETSTIRLVFLAVYQLADWPEDIRFFPAWVFLSERNVQQEVKPRFVFLDLVKSSKSLGGLS